MLEGKLHDLFVCNDVLDQFNDMEDLPENITPLANKIAADILSKKVMEDINDIGINPTNLIKHFK